MGRLIPIQYHRCRYPDGIQARITEIAGNFDSSYVKMNQPFSLHTEYSYMRRSFKSPAVKSCSEILSAHKNGIPMLWTSELWAREFVTFVKELSGNKAPKIVEIHPPFADYSDINHFFDVYAIFEKCLLSLYPHVNILIENRCGTRHKAGFIFSSKEQLISFSKRLDQLNLCLKITLDIPQLFTAHSISNIKKSEMLDIMQSMKMIRHNIEGIHLWGKNLDRHAHCGDLNTYFRNNLETKTLFLSSLLELIDDEKPRYFVPEVNSGQNDFLSIINDLLQAGINFVS